MLTNLDVHSIPSKLRKDEELMRMMSVFNDFNKFLNTLHFCRLDPRKKKEVRDLISTKKKIKLNRKRILILINKKLKSNEEN